MNNMTPEMIQAVLAAGGEDPEQAGLQRQQAMVDQMRGKALNGPGQQVVDGRVIPNWAPALGNMLGGYMANKQQPTIDAGMQGVKQRGVNTRKQYLDAMLQSMRMGQQSSQQMQPSPPEPQAY